VLDIGSCGRGVVRGWKEGVVVNEAWLTMEEERSGVVVCLCFCDDRSEVCVVVLE